MKNKKMNLIKKVILIFFVLVIMLSFFGRPANAFTAEELADSMENGVNNILNAIMISFDYLYDLVLPAPSANVNEFLDTTAKKSNTIFISVNGNKKVFAVKESTDLKSEQAMIIVQYPNAAGKDICSLIKKDYPDAKCYYDEEKSSYVAGASRISLLEKEKPFWNSLTQGIKPR